MVATPVLIGGIGTDHPADDGTDDDDYILGE